MSLLRLYEHYVAAVTLTLLYVPMPLPTLNVEFEKPITSSFWTP